ncbi:FmdB family zinc ribbon protein [Myxococcota bacterium]
MPIYEYYCAECGDQFEHLQGFSDKPLRKCKKCGGRLKKLVSECSFHLKGSGWYVTDYGGKKPSGNGKLKKEKEKPAESKPKPSEKPSEKQKQAS